MGDEIHVAYVIFKEYLGYAEDRFDGAEAYEAMWYLLCVIFEKVKIDAVPEKYKDFVALLGLLVLENHRRYVEGLVDWHEG